MNSNWSDKMNVGMGVDGANISELVLNVCSEFSEVVSNRLDSDFEQGLITDKQYKHYSGLLFRYETAIHTLAIFYISDLLPLDKGERNVL